MKHFFEPLSEDEQDEYEWLSRKMENPEHRLDTYYPEEIKTAVTVESSNESNQLLLHSGLLHLEKAIYNMR